MSTTTIDSSADGILDVRTLGSGVLVVACDIGTRLRSAARIETLSGAAPAPLTTLRLPLANGGTRVLWAFRPPASERPLVLRAFTGVLVAGRLIDLQPGARYRPADLAALAAGLEPAARISLVSALLGVWSSVFHLRRDPAFARAIRKLAEALSPSSAITSVEADIGEGRALHRTVLPDALGDVRAIYAVSARGIEHLPRCWHRADARQKKRVLRLVGPADFIASDRLVIVGEHGVAIRNPRRAAIVLTLPQWWQLQVATASDRLREFVARAVAEAGPHGHSASLEFQMKSPLRPRQLAGRNGSPSFGVELALAEPAGLVVAGWMRDPGGFIDKLEAEDESGARHAVAWHRFQLSPTAANPNPPTGFIGFAATYRTETLVLQPRLYLNLTSGTQHRIVPRPQPADPIGRRALLLRATPQQHLSETILAEFLAPVLGTLQKTIQATLPPPRIEQIGSPVPHPAVSVVVPLYRNLSFLRAQIGAFAADPELARAELIYVLDSPEQAADVLHLMQGLHLLHGLPITLVVMARNGGYAAACNAGARVARGVTLAMLNSDVIPMSSGWLDRLAGRLSPKVGICGPKLLFEDNSIQHAGMFFSVNQFGRWINNHFYKGLPRNYAPATVDRLVPAVTGACLFVRRDVFEAVGGFTEDYVIGDYEDSDLCLKVRRSGYEIAYVAGVELYHLERQSIRQSADYMRGSADRYNGWLHARRWADDMRRLMASAGGTSLRSAA
ncbi:MAG TPA: glycosyltransferase [Bauldia sp.]|nr:glycosyltransferase [Bauldia sp.]